MKAKLPSWKFVSALILAAVSTFFVKTAHAAATPARSLALPARNIASPDTEVVFHGTLVESDGVTATSSIDRKWDAPTGTGTLNEAELTPAGQVASREANLVRNADGTFTARGTMTDFDGHSVNYTETLTRNAHGYVARGTTAGIGGETTSYVATVAFLGRNEIRRTTVTTKADGTSATRIETIKSRAS